MHQSVGIIGPITSELKYAVSNSGTPWVKFTVQVTDSTHEKHIITDFVVVCFGKLAQKAVKEWLQGTVVSISGRVSLAKDKTTGESYIQLLADSGSLLNVGHTDQSYNALVNAPGEVTPPISSGQSPFKQANSAAKPGQNTWNGTKYMPGAAGKSKTIDVNTPISDIPDTPQGQLKLKQAEDLYKKLAHMAQAAQGPQSPISAKFPNPVPAQKIGSQNIPGSKSSIQPEAPIQPAIPDEGDMPF